MVAGKTIGKGKKKTIGYGRKLIVPEFCGDLKIPSRLVECRKAIEIGLFSDEIKDPRRGNQKKRK